MSFTALGSLGSASNKVASQTLTLSPSRLVPGNSGRLIAVFVAWEGDRNYSDGAGFHDSSIACTDSVGNLYSELQSGLYDVSDSMFLTYVDNDLTTGDTITITHRATTLKAKAISAEEFSIEVGNRFMIWRDKLQVREDPNDGDARGGPLTISGLDSGTEYLFLHCMGNNRPSSDSYTWDSDYTQIVSGGTTGGLANTNVTLRGGYRIVSGITSDTVDINNNTADTTNMRQGFVAISETTVDFNFPTFPNLDTFNRANEDPLAQPPWNQATTGGPGFQTARLRVVSNKCARSLVTGSGEGSMWWLATIPAGDDGEVFVTLDTVNTGVYTAFCFANGAGQDTTLDSYAIESSTVGGARPDIYSFGEAANSGNGVSTPVYIWHDRANGHKMGLQMRDSGVQIHLWLDLGSGWRWASGWHKTTFVKNGGKFGLNIGGDSVARFDDFGGGTSIRFLPQIFRRLPGK